MIIKTFTAESSSAVLKKVRHELGGDAIMLKTRELTDANDKNRIEVTACLEKPSVAQATSALSSGMKRPVIETNSSKLNMAEDTVSAPRADSSDLDMYDRIKKIEKIMNRMISMGFQPQDKSNSFAAFKTIHSALLESDVPTDYIDGLISSLDEKNGDSSNIAKVARDELSRSLSKIMASPPVFNAPAKIMFVGPAGSGKSSLLGKVAAHLVSVEKKKVRLVSIDDIKIGAIDEIGSYADLLGTELADPKALVNQSNENSDTITLIDTSAVPRQAEQFKLLADRIKAISPDYIVVVFSALIRSADMTEFAASIKPLRPTHLAMSMVDLTTRHGSMLAAAITTGLKISYISDAPGGKGKISAPNVEKFVSSLLREGGEIE
jgi:flagellar biosynthesis protein FlhF